MVGIILVFVYEFKFFNYFLEFVINELKVFWIGVKVNICNSLLILVEVCVVFLCCVVDIFVVWKLCGFFGYFVNRGCFYCYKFFFGGFGECKDYSGFDRD